MFEKHPEEGEQAVFSGSAVVYTGDSAEEVRGVIEKDIYATSGVWDLKKVQIIPVRQIRPHLYNRVLMFVQYVAAVRQPL